MIEAAPDLAAFEADDLVFMTEDRLCGEWPMTTVFFFLSWLGLSCQRTWVPIYASAQNPRRFISVVGVSSCTYQWSAVSTNEMEYVKMADEVMLAIYTRAALVLLHQRLRGKTVRDLGGSW